MKMPHKYSPILNEMLIMSALGFVVFLFQQLIRRTHKTFISGLSGLAMAVIVANIIGLCLDGFVNDGFKIGVAIFCGLISDYLICLIFQLLEALRRNPRGVWEGLKDVRATFMAKK